ncbi:MAG: hypothetical protein A2293_07000 [Elusimicrobia bacterium RIFOXYB2_FULL_49_7]|nr:MAG: hypothetical protein A2293_07000 [Elusimicrobia bacterium RIFOXYB2_FULL_49_7]
MFRSLRFKLSLPLFIAILVIAVAVSVIILRNFKAFYIDSLVEQESHVLQYFTATFSDTLLTQRDTRAVERYALFVDSTLRRRVTIVDTGGIVLGDSRVAPDSVVFLENHRTRPEIIGLQQGTTAFDYEVRYSHTLNQRMLYAAVPIIRQKVLLGYLRFSLPLREIEGYLRSQVMTLLLFIAGAFFFLGFTVYFFSRRIQDVVREIGENARLIESGKGGERVHFGFSNETDRLYDFLDDTADRLRLLIHDIVSQREEFRALLRSVSEAVVAVDGRLDVVFANDNACRLFDSTYTSDTLPPMWLTGFTHHPAFQNQGDEVIRLGRRSEQMVALKGVTRDIELKSVCIPLITDQEPKSNRLLFTLVDLTEEKRLARAKADFVEAASHELRTPLTVLKGYVEMIEEMPDEATRRMSYGKMRHSVQRLENLIHDLLQLSYLESGKVALQLDTFSLEQTVNEIINDVKPLIDDKKIELSVDCRLPLNSVPELIYIALYNLITNAIKYNRPAGRIEITGVRSNGAYDITVRDSGIGIPSEFREHVFERFFRIEKHRSRDTGGTGLGLAIVKHIVQVLKGTIKVSDGLSGGTVFTITLPQ